MTAAFLLLKGHKLEYFFSLSLCEKMFAYAAMEKELKKETDLALLMAGRSGL